jgi:hypothetical protein
MRTWIIDDRGDAFLEGEARLSEKLLTERRGADFTRWLVAQMGFIAIEEHGGWRRIVLDRTRVSPQAITGCLYWLADHAFFATSCEHPADRKLSAIFQEKSQLIAFLCGLIEPAVPAYGVRRVTSEQSVFASRWRAAREIYTSVTDPAARTSILDTLFQGHFAVAQLGEDGDYRLREVGSRLHFLDPEFAETCNGRSFRQAHDPDYGRSSADHFGSLRGEDDPVFEDVQAVVSFPRLSRRRISYDRLCLPLRRAVERPYLFIATHLH